MNKVGDAVLIIVIVGILLAAMVAIFFIVKNDKSDDDTEEPGPVVEPEPVPEEVPVEMPINDSGNLTDVPEQEPVIQAVDSFPNAEGPHWPHMPLTYKIENKIICGDKPIEKLEEVFENIKTSTGVIEFVEGDENVDIEIKCIDGAPLLNGSEVTCDEQDFDYEKVYLDPVREGFIEDGDYLVNVSEIELNVTVNSSVLSRFVICYVDSSNSGIGFLKESEPLISNNLILRHKINLYKTADGFNSCATFPARETHEILHGFGIAHSDEPLFDPNYGWPAKDINLLQDIMFPSISCKYQKKLDSKYTSCLKNIYGGEGDCSEVYYLSGGI
jgi:hypothetical protein